ncbi:MAG: hypothetical protein M1827_005022 [Pycnora praestabilis]|nr:MAG: hypothetical protein M1827_005022 [Pycnora praestabilis]
MGSSRSPQPQMPFGYSFHDMNNWPYPSPPAPAPGPALLDDTESNMLDNFFDKMGSSGFENGDVFFDRSMPGQEDGGLGLNWATELPPTFHGSTTSLAQPSAIGNNIPVSTHHSRNGHHTNSNELQPITTSADVLAAASTLFQNGQVGHFSATLGGNSILPARVMGNSYHDGHARGVSSDAQPIDTYQGTINESTRTSSISSSQQRALPNDMRQAYYNGMNYGRPHSSQSADAYHYGAKVGEIRWGSDGSFLTHGYVAPPNQETEEEVTKDLMQKLECFEPQSSANNTEPSSPMLLKQSHHRKKPSSGRKGTNVIIEQISEDEEDEDLAELNNEADLRPKKRRKSKFKDEDKDEAIISPQRVKGRKGKAAANGRKACSRKVSKVDGSPERRKIQSGDVKSNRENLTEEQKRSNHILSEQKRRNLIKQGFEDLCELVPELRGGGFSKSAMLIQAADWLEDIMKGNEVLKAQLASLKGNSDA